MRDTVICNRVLSWSEKKINLGVRAAQRSCSQKNLARARDIPAQARESKTVFLIRAAC